MYMELARRIRIRSWKDLVVLVVGIIIYALSIWIMHKLSVPEKVVKIVSAIIVFVVMLILMFALKA